MSKPYTLKTKITLAIAMTSLFIVLLISLLSNFLINKKFVDYIAVQQQEKTAEIVSSLSQQYYQLSDTWDLNFIHTIGMYALYDGYIIRIENMNNASVWDAQEHDMSTCAQVMADIKERMEKKYPSIDGEFVSAIYPLVQAGRQIGTVEISYFGPFFLSENDFDFLETLNTILLSITLVSLVISIVLGRYLANWLSNPILKTVAVSRQMADGDYAALIEERTTTLELNQLIDSINHLAKTLDRQEILRKRLTADVAHELRTPLTTMGTHIEAMIEGVWEPTTERLQSCHEEIDRISKLVMDLERLAKVEDESIKLNKQPVNGVQIIHKVVDGLSIEIKNKNIILNIETSEHCCKDIIGDSDRLHQLFYNLLSNAIKYTPDNGNISISIIDNGDYTDFCFKDSGIGISEEDLPFVFERFYRAEKSRNRATGGSGIGLAIVKAIVSAHEGKIFVESTLDSGSLFIVSLKNI